MGWKGAPAWAAVVAVVSGSPGAWAEDLVAVRPGVMCASAAALGKLTLPGGDSRTHLARPAPADLALAQDGGCIDIPAGARVAVQQGFKNTSVVLYPLAGAAPMVVPNIDFVAAEGGGGAAPAGVGAPAGYRVQQRMVTGSEVLEILEDRRITPAIRAGMWHYNDEPVDDRFRPLPPFAQRPVLKAVVRLLSPAGEELERATLDEPLAEVKPAGLHGLPHPAFLLAVDNSNMTSNRGLLYYLLVPAETGLRTVSAIPDRGGAETPMEFWNVLRSMWQVVPGRGGASDTIQAASCTFDDGSGRPSATYQTFRFRDGRWHVAVRTARECDEYESPPPRSAFP